MLNVFCYLAPLPTLSKVANKKTYSKVAQLYNFNYICNTMKKIIAYKRYYADFMAKLSQPERIKIMRALLLFETEDKKITFPVEVKDETVWLSQQQMATLFNVKENNITYHIKGVYKMHELEPEATTQKIRVVQNEGARKVSREVTFYSLDAIIAVGYRFICL
mgnify:CR=1 FL=1